MVSFAAATRSTITLSILAAVAQASLVIPTSLKEQAGLICGVKTYSTPGAWSFEDYLKLEATLIAPVTTLDFGIETLLSTPGAGHQTPAPLTSSTCNVTSYSMVAPAVANCTNIAITDLVVPGNTTLDLTKLKANSVVTFYGHNIWTYVYGAKNDLMKIKGSNITVQGAPCSVLDGQGQLFWDGIGSNGGVPKPDHFISASSLGPFSVFKNLLIKNAPTHVFSLSTHTNFLFRSIVIDMKDGYQILPSGLEAGHNSDGIDSSSGTNSLFTNSVVFNQDDCVAITSGNHVVANNFFCNGGHGLSIGSVGGKSNNTVESITFSNSVVLNSQNGPRIKTNSGTNGTINNVKYENIAVSNISIYGIDVQTDYLNGGPTGCPTPFNITNITFQNIIGTAQATADDYYILVANSSFATQVPTWKFNNVHISGGSSSCDVIPPGLSGCHLTPINSTCASS